MVWTQYTFLLKMSIWVTGVLRRAVVGAWYFDNQGGCHLQSQVTLKSQVSVKSPVRVKWLFASRHRLSKHQSATTVLVSSPVTQMITANQGIFVLASLGSEKRPRIQVGSLRTTSGLTTTTQKLRLNIRVDCGSFLISVRHTSEQNVRAHARLEDTRRENFWLVKKRLNLQSAALSVAACRNIVVRMRTVTARPRVWCPF